MYIYKYLHYVHVYILYTCKYNMYMYIYIYIEVNITHTHIYIYKDTHIHIYIYIYDVHIYNAHTHIYTYIYVYIYLFLYGYSIADRGPNGTHHGSLQTLELRLACDVLEPRSRMRNLQNRRRQGTSCKQFVVTVCQCHGKKEPNPSESTILDKRNQL